MTGRRSMSLASVFLGVPLAATVLVGLGEPGAVPNTAQAVLSALYLAGLALAWRTLDVPTSASEDGDGVGPPGR